MNQLRVSNLSVVVEQQSLLSDIYLNIESGELVAILGSNGAGKSTLLNCIVGAQAFSGLVSWNETPVSSMNSTDKARAISYLPQNRPTSWPLRVKDIVALGRYAFGATPGNLSPTDSAAVTAAMQSCNLMALQDRQIDTLSGGEQARVHCARTFASEAPLLVADEPTNSLDPKHQLEILTMISSYVDQDRSGLVVLHEPALAARFATRLIWLKNGSIVADGTPAETLTRETMALVYEVNAGVDLSGPIPLVQIENPLE